MARKTSTDRSRKMAGSNTLERNYIVQSITQASDGRMYVTLFEDNTEADATGAPMGSNNLTFTMSVDEARQFFPGDHVTVTLQF